MTAEMMVSDFQRPNPPADDVKKEPGDAGLFGVCRTASVWSGNPVRMQQFIAINNLGDHFVYLVDW